MGVPSYDKQAAGYDRRAGLGDDVCRAVAAHIFGLVGHGRIIEWGCGTGEIGVFLAGANYTGLDSSALMLEEFRKRSPTADLVVADGDGVWPFEDGSIRAVFGSRSLHLMNSAHVASECRRLEAMVLVGRVERQRDSLRARMRRRMQNLLRKRGYVPRDGRSKQRDLFDALHAGARPEPVDVVSWTVTHRPGEALASWAGKQGIAGITPDPTDKREILAILAGEFGDPDADHASEERYTVAVMERRGP